MKFAGMTIGIPKEIMPHEARVAALPETVRRMKDAGARVRVERGAGAGCHVADTDYASAGAELCPDPASLYADADVILKVKEPRFHDGLARHEIEMMQAGQYLVAFLHPASPDNRDMLRRLAERNVTALTLDGIPRISRTQNMDALTSMSTVAGYKAMLMAADALEVFVPPMGTAAGAIPPARAAVVGAGIAGLQAVATARRLGAAVQASDIRPSALEQAASLGAQIVDPDVPPEAALGAGGYARELPAELLQRERTALHAALAAADIVVLAALIPGRRAPILMAEDTVAAMRPGSVIVDVAVDQGGNCAVTVPGETVVRHGVTIMGIKNIPGRVPRAASWMFAQNVFHFLSYLADDGRIRLDLEDEVVASTLTVGNGEIVHAGALATLSAQEGSPKA